MGKTDTTRGAWSLLTIVVLGIVVFIADIADNFGYISRLLEFEIKVVCLVGMSLSVLAQIRANASKWPRAVAALIAMVVGCVTLLILSADDTVIVGRIPYLQQGSFVRQTIERLCAVTWASLPLVMISLYLRKFDCMKSQLVDLGSQTARELTASHDRLRQEVRERMSTANERDQARLELESALEGSSPRRADADEVVLKHERLTAIKRISTGIAHELNNALTPVVSYSDLLLNNADLPSEQSQWLTHLCASSHDALRVVRNLQQFYQDEKKDPFCEVSLAEIVRQVVDTTQPFWKDAPTPQGGSIVVRAELSGTQQVRGNADQLRQVVTNLLLNAIESVDADGKVTISLESDGQTLCVNVADNGRGMSPRVAARCFEPFFTTKHNGAGLGLSVCHGIIQNHGGTLDISTAPGKGTTFSVRLPVGAEVSTTTGERPTSEVLADVRILLVDDNERVRLSVTDMLEIVGATVAAVASGDEAIAYVKKERFDVILTDLGLPEMDGSEVVAKARELCDTPIILMSGWPNSRIMERLKGKPHPDAILSKPTQFKQLVDLTKSLISSDRLSIAND